MRGARNTSSEGWVLPSSVTQDLCKLQKPPQQEQESGDTCVHVRQSGAGTRLKMVAERGAIEQEAENLHLQSETQTGVGKPEGTGGLELSEPFLSNILPLERLGLQKTTHTHTRTHHK